MSGNDDRRLSGNDDRRMSGNDDRRMSDRWARTDDVKRDDVRPHDRWADNRRTEDVRTHDKPPDRWVEKDPVQRDDVKPSNNGQTDDFPPLTSTPKQEAPIVEESPKPVKKEEKVEKVKQSKEVETQEKERKQQEEIERQKLEEQELLDAFCALTTEEEIKCFHKEHESLNTEKMIYSLLQTYKDDSWLPKYKSIFKNMNDSEKECQVLWAIQKYCYSMSFPKVDSKPLILSLFETMFHKNVVDYEAYFEWKDDESKEHELGKTKAIIQTMEWFQYLDDMLAEEEEEYEEDEEDFDGGY